MFKESKRFLIPKQGIEDFSNSSLSLTAMAASTAQSIPILRFRANDSKSLVSLPGTSPLSAWFKWGNQTPVLFILLRTHI